METLRDIEAAVRRLSVGDRARLMERLGDLPTEVREPAPAYQTEQTPLSVEDYLRYEEGSEVRHEYVSGILYAMSGVSEPHHLIAGNLFAALHAHLHGGPCRTYMSDFKLRLQIDQEDLFYYPDLMVACEREGVQKYYLRYPKLIVEVLSPSTASIDRREKRIHYAQIRTMEEYVIASQEDYQVFYHCKAERWAPRRLAGPGAVLELRSIGLTLPLAEVYDRVL
jgi:Uma2 family endonuclease